MAMGVIKEDKEVTGEGVLLFIFIFIFLERTAREGAGSTSESLYELVHLSVH